jgi:hypothetical protein
LAKNLLLKVKMLAHQTKKRRRRRLKINKNLPHQVRKLGSKNQASVQVQVKLRVLGIDPLGTARKLPMRKKKSDSY